MQKLKQNLLTYRGLNALLVLFTMIGMGFALLFLQKHLGLAPCPLCIFQRIGLMVMGIFALIAAIFAPKKRGIRLFLWLGSILGILWSLGVAARHVWLQHLPPDQVPSCGPGLDYWLDALPMQQVVQQVLSGSGECAAISWRFLGLSIPEQSLIFFSFLLLINLLIAWRIFRPQNAK
ncbi:disulfide bond formation protein B [Psychrobacter sp. I-STPA6b]|uniref:disulfide bond formation protein B n=1 Tax=Psychrobacter sp. I-STPA6b TaxID=2585718 RepID=UPI001D0C3917|nr:disulfide bond formation protein B [Psychrobacter sp. I-STPA6b]